MLKLHLEKQALQSRLPASFLRLDVSALKLGGRRCPTKFKGQESSKYHLLVLPLSKAFQVKPEGVFSVWAGVVMRFAQILNPSTFRPSVTEACDSDDLMPWPLVNAFARAHASSLPAQRAEHSAILQAHLSHFISITSGGNK